MPLPTPGQSPTDPFSTRRPPILAAAALFLFTANADRYEVAVIDGEPELVPVLSRHVIAPGFHGISTRPDQPFDPALDTEAFRARLARKGEVVIGQSLAVPKDCLPPGATEGGYHREMLVYESAGATQPVTHHQEVWQLVEVDNQNRALLSYDLARYTRWRLWLRNQGHAPAPSAYIKRRLTNEADTKVLRLRETPSADAALKAQKVDAAQAQAEVIRSAHAAARPKGKPPKAEAASAA